MIKVRFYLSDGRYKGFEITGHSGSAEKGRDIVCAAVSSAAYMTANTVSEIYKAPAEISDDDGHMKLLLQEDSDELQNLLKGFELHIRELSGQFPKNIKVIYGGSKNA
ncbi:MAG: ribosomal-processing cysteine protease Prp [Clostridiales bacterium]|nr:ribosomal-processing cysteine protease Prp [Clostridiales bacterium]